MKKRNTKYSDRYFFTDSGDIITTDWKGCGQTKVMKPSIDKRGYLRTMLKHADGVIKTIKVHRVIAETFVPNPDNLPQVNHKNGIKTDNRVTNLEWVTGKQNSIHARENNLGAGQRLTREIVEEIRRLKDHKTSNQIAEMYGITPRYCRQILNRKRWK